MPVEGLPTTLEYTMNSLLQTDGLTSFKIAGNPNTTTIVLRFGVMAARGTASPRVVEGDSGGPLRTPLISPGVWRRKSQREQQRDQQRYEHFISNKPTSSNMFNGYHSSFGHHSTPTPSPLFMSSNETETTKVPNLSVSCPTSSIDEISTVTEVGNEISSVSPTQPCVSDPVIVPTQSADTVNIEQADVNIESGSLCQQSNDTNIASCKNSLLSSPVLDSSSSGDRDRLQEFRDSPDQRENQCELEGDMKQGEEIYAGAGDSSSATFITEPDVPNPNGWTTYPTEKRFAEVHRTAAFKDYVSKLNKDLTIKLEDTSRLEATWRKAVIDKENNRVLAHTLDGLVVVCDTKAHRMTYWFSTDAKLKPKEEETLKRLELLDQASWRDSVVQLNLVAMCEDRLRQLLLDELKT